MSGAPQFVRAIVDSESSLALPWKITDSAQGSPSPFLLVRNDGKAHGRLEGFLEATIDLALADPSLREAVRAHMVKALG